MEQFYHSTLLAGCTVTAVLAVCLLLTRTPGNEIYHTYRRAKKLLGAGYAAYSLGIGVFVAAPLRWKYADLCQAVNLTYYFAAMFLFGYSFIALLKPQYICRERTRRFSLTYLAYVTTMWAAILLFPGYRHWITAAYGLWFLAETTILIRGFLTSYTMLKRQLENYYADTTAGFIRWMNTSAWLVIVFGVMCGVFAFGPYTLNTFLMLAGIVVFVYIYLSWQNYALHLMPVQVVADDPVPNIDSPAGEEPPAFAAYISEWVERRGYTADKTTLAQLAQEAGTNRTYLSAYINSTYGCCFSEWVNGLRLELARQQMSRNPELTLEAVALECGFSSLSYFSRLFKQRFGIPPSEYRRHNHDGDPC